MVQGVEVDLFRPDDELKKLAKLAVSLELDKVLADGNVDEALAAVAKAPDGAQWIAAWKSAQDPWFNFTSGNGFYSDDKYWIEHLDIPLGYIRVLRRAGAQWRGHRSPDRQDRGRTRPHHVGISRIARAGSG